MSDEFVPKLVHLPGTGLSPQVVLHRTLDRLDRIKAVAIIIQWDDDSFDSDWSQMRVSELCMAAMSFDDEVRDTMRGNANLLDAPQQK